MKGEIKSFDPVVRQRVKLLFGSPGDSVFKRQNATLVVRGSPKATTEFELVICKL